MTYLEHVTVYFVSLVGKGVTPSSRDLAVVRRWEADGIPAPVVCRALRRAFADHNRRPSRASLADFAGPVDRLLATLPVPADRPGNPRERMSAAQLRERVVLIGRATCSEPARQAYRALYRALTEQPPDALLDAEALARLDEVTVSALRQQVPARELRRRHRHAERRARQLLGRDASDGATGRLAASLLENALCETHGLALPSALADEESEP